MALRRGRGAVVWEEVGPFSSPMVVPVTDFAGEGDSSRLETPPQRQGEK